LGAPPISSADAVFRGIDAAASLKRMNRTISAGVKKGWYASLAPWQEFKLVAQRKWKRSVAYN
jgi:hypothetical protein